jgi:transcriptional regulator with XRE-family HTH domain
MAAGVSQKQLGILAGLDPFVASTRINRYELGVHWPDYQIALKLAEVLQIPVGYLYESDDVLAELLVLALRLDPLELRLLLARLRQDSGDDALTPSIC